MSLLPQDPAANAVPPIDSVESNVCTAEHCLYAFDTLFCALTGNTPIKPQFSDEKFPLFVTWNTRSSRPSRPPRLRGCIGTFEPQPIHEGLAEYALISAFKDYRFNRIEKQELESLECVISLLTDFEDASSYLDWTIGVHGIHISFSQPSLLLASSAHSSGSNTPSPLSSSYSLPTTRFSSKRPHSATYLPEVAPEQGWDKLETVDSAIRKAGYDGHITEDLRRSVKLRRYQSRKHSAGWEEFVEWREQNGGKI